MKSRSVIVVGAGIVGASIAWHLARKGAAVTIVEAGEAGGVATPNSFAWLNATCGNARGYFDLRLASMREWRRLDAEVEGLAVDFCGSLRWDKPLDELAACVEERAGWDYGLETVAREEIARREPALAKPPEAALLAPLEGAVEPDRAARTLIADAVRRGAGLVSATRVEALIVKAGRVACVATTDGPLHADEIVIATGAATPALAASAGVDVALSSPPGLLVHSHPHERILTGLLMGPKAHVRQAADGRIVAGADFGGGGPVEDVEQAANDLFSDVQAMLKGGDGISYDFASVGYRPVPEGGMPLVGRPSGVEGLYVAVMHSGMTLAPAVGLFASREILSCERDPLLRPFGFAETDRVPA